MDNNEEIIKRLKYIIQELGLTQNGFASRIGIDSSNLSKYLKGKLAINESLINRIVINLGLSKKWLMSGSDLPFAKESAGNIPQSSLSGHLRVDSSHTDGTPVYDIDVTAGIMPRARMFASENIIGSIKLPGIPSDCRIVKVSGDSMSPVIRNGDMIAVRELTNIKQIFWGQIYVVILDDYCMVKYVRRHSDPDKVILRSENPKYDDMEIERSEIRDMMFVQHILHLDTRM